jgi:pimeloyl-ACP methyl ester carboxylesterase
MTTLRLFKSEFFNFEALRLLSFTAHDGGEVAEFLSGAGKIKDLDLEGWYKAWIDAGYKAESLAAQAELSGNRAAARRAFFCASNYQRAAQFMLDGRSGIDTRPLYDSERAISNFWQAAQLLDSSVKRLEIPYEGGITLPAYLHIPHPSKRLPGKIPLLLNTVGADATQEEIFYIFPMAALELGYAVITFEGPGQGIVLRRHGIPFRPDWEVVVKVVLDFTLDYIAARPETNIDTEKLAIAGSSMGGYLSLRGAIDPRIKACVAVDPFYAMWDMLKGRVPEVAMRAFVAENSYVPESTWDLLTGFLGYWNVQTRWESMLTCWMLGATTTSGMFRCMRQYTLEGHLERVKCPVFVTGARFSLYCQPEVSTERIYRELIQVPEDKKSMWIGEDPGEGGLQSKVGSFTGLSQKTFAWLDSVLGIDRKISGTFKSWS